MSSSLPRTGLEVFRRHHGRDTLDALAWYARYMRQNSDEIQASYDQIKDDPEARARQDASIVTTNGLLHSARAVREAAGRADETATAYKALRDRASADDLDWFSAQHGHVLTNALMVRAEQDADAADAARSARQAWQELTEADDEDEGGN